MKITFVGHVCIDRNVVRGVAETFYGGGVIHGSVTARRLGADSTVLTKCRESDRAGFTSFAEAGVETAFIASPETTSIRNTYPSENPDERNSSVISRAEPFTENDIAGVEADIVHLNPLWFGEFPVELLPVLKRRAGMLGSDAQGFLRHVDDGGAMVYRDLARKREILSLIDIFKVDSKEARILTGLEDVRQAARAVHDLGPGIVLLTHAGGVCAFDGTEFHESPFSGFTLEGRTGRGDTCTGAFLSAMTRMNLSRATALAADVTSRKMQYRGPYRG
jgi:sugar/nucleoside kinase (ribokinase family)